VRDRRKPRRAHALDRVPERAILGARELRVGVRDREVRERALHPDVRAVLPEAEQLVELPVPADAEPRHAGVDLQVRERRPALPAGGFLERLERAGVVHGDRDAPANSFPGAAGNDASHGENRPRDAGLAQLERLLEDRDGERLRAGGLEPLCDRNQAVAIGVRLDHGHDLHIVPHRRADFPVVLFNRRERDREGGASQSASTSLCESTPTPLFSNNSSAREGSESLSMISACLSRPRTNEYV